MYIPEYTITSRILKNISSIEYGKAIIENKPILTHWEKQLAKESKVKTIENSLRMDHCRVEHEKIKKIVDGMAKTTKQEVTGFINAYKMASESLDLEIDEGFVRKINEMFTKNKASYRRQQKEKVSAPEEILADMVRLFDWYSSLDAKETHAVIVAGILIVQLENISPFEKMSHSTANLTAKAHLKTERYDFKGFLSLEESFATNINEYNAVITPSEGDLTKWLEFFTDCMSREVSNLRERVTLLARDTKIAKVSGRVALTERQERIIEFLQDYGMLINKDFGRLFPNVSEDSILRDLKILINKKIVVKTGKTKSSRYELG